MSETPQASLLDELLREGVISRAQCDLYRSRYAKLHELVLQTYENERNFLRRAKELNHQLVSEKINLERTTIAQSEDQATIAALQAQLNRTLEESAARFLLHASRPGYYIGVSEVWRKGLAYLFSYRYPTFLKAFSM